MAVARQISAVREQKVNDRLFKNVICYLVLLDLLDKKRVAC